MEADLVSHGGGSAAGSFVHTLTLTDMASGWTECVALVVRDGALVVAALEHIGSISLAPLEVNGRSAFSDPSCPAELPAGPIS
jgi:hypothetical protein